MGVGGSEKETDEDRGWDKREREAILSAAVLLSSAQDMTLIVPYLNQSSFPTSCHQHLRASTKGNNSRWGWRGTSPLLSFLSGPFFVLTIPPPNLSRPKKLAQALKWEINKSVCEKSSSFSLALPFPLTHTRTATRMHQHTKNTATYSNIPSLLPTQKQIIKPHRVWYLDTSRFTSSFSSHRARCIKLQEWQHV